MGFVPAHGDELSISRHSNSLTAYTRSSFEIGENAAVDGGCGDDGVLVRSQG